MSSVSFVVMVQEELEAEHFYGEHAGMDPEPVPMMIP